MKNKTSKIVKTFNMLAGILFIASIYLSIKWSSVPVVDITIFNNSFWKNVGNVDNGIRIALEAGIPDERIINAELI